MAKRPFTTINSAQDVRDTADALGSYYFSPATMRAFASRLLDTFHAITEDGSRGVIVTSERDTFGGYPREYAVRAYTVTRDPETGRDAFDADIIGERYRSAYMAKSAAKRHADTERAALATEAGK